jgi:hypothetical protein
VGQYFDSPQPGDRTLDLASRLAAVERQVNGIKRGHVSGTFAGTQTWVITSTVTHGMGATPRVLCSLSEYFELASLIATVQPYSVGSTTFAFLVTVSGPNPTAGTVVNVNYEAWIE